MAKLPTPRRATSQNPKNADKVGEVVAPNEEETLKDTEAEQAELALGDVQPDDDEGPITIEPTLSTAGPASFVEPVEEPDGARHYYNLKPFCAITIARGGEHKRVKANEKPKRVKLTREEALLFADRKLLEPYIGD